MILATVCTAGGHAAVRVDGGEAIELGYGDVNDLLQQSNWRDIASGATGRRLALEGIQYAPVVPKPKKIICVGLNYSSHILEMGRELPKYPTLFAKFQSCLVGARDPIQLPEDSDHVDWEAELAFVIGERVHRVSRDVARSAIAGFTILNDISMRDWQRRTSEWLQGKAFDLSTPVGPWLVTADELDRDVDLELSCEVNGKTRQVARTSDLLFSPEDLVAYISQFTTLEPGDLISTGTPGGVGDAQIPKVFLQDGDVVVTRISGLGEMRNRCAREAAIAVGDPQ